MKMNLKGRKNDALYTIDEKSIKTCLRCPCGTGGQSWNALYFHPYEVALQVQTEEEVCAALLHDVVEDTDWTMEDLRAAGFPETVLEAVQLLTHDSAVPYLDYVRALCGNPIAVAVKRADLHHNSERTRFDADSLDIEKRLQKYAAAEAVLDEAEKKMR